MRMAGLGLTMAWGGEWCWSCEKEVLLGGERIDFIDCRELGHRNGIPTL